MRSQTLMERSASSRVSDHEASGNNDSSALESALAPANKARQSQLVDGGKGSAVVQTCLAAAPAAATSSALPTSS